MTGDSYLQSILQREAVDTSVSSPLRMIQAYIEPDIKEWAGPYLQSITPSGSFAKNTGNSSKVDIDLFVSLSPHTPSNYTLKDLYEGLFEHLLVRQYSPRRQNVSIGISVNGKKVDLIPAKQQDGRSNDHSLYVRKRDSWTKTNVAKHIDKVSRSGRTDEIRIIKLWRDQWGIDWESIYVELMVLDALSGRRIGDLANNVFASFEYIRDRIKAARIVDPANLNNVISDDLSVAEKQSISDAAATARNAKYWSEIVK